MNKIIGENLFEFKKGLDPVDSMGLGRRAMIEEWMQKFLSYTNYKILDNLEIDILDSPFSQFTIFDSQSAMLENGKLPNYIQFNKWHLNSSITLNDLISFEGFPRDIEGYFTCIVPNIKSLRYIPNIHVKKHKQGSQGYVIKNAKLQNIIGLNAKIEGCLCFKNCQINSLEGLPKIVGGKTELPSAFEKDYEKIKKQIQTLSLEFYY